MPGIEEDRSLRLAAEQLQRYLSDEIAPMMAVEDFEELVPHHPDVTARIIAGWVDSQHRAADDGVTTADLIFHALKKLSLLVELELVRRATTMRSIHEISRRLLQVCPDAQRDELRLRLSRLGESATVVASRAEFLHREAGTGATAPPSRASTTATPEAGTGKRKPEAESMGRGARVLSLLLGRLTKLRNPKAPPEKEGPEAAMLAQILTTAALEAKSNDDLARHLESVQQEGIATPIGRVFRTLGWSLPGWGTIDQNGQTVQARTGRQLKAMDRIISLAPDATERAKRWGEMIYAAIEQLNEGRLAQAVSILEVAKQLIAARKPDAVIVRQILSQSEAAISENLLRRLADVPAKHGLLRKVLDFFPSYRPEPLLTRLDGEARRERRKLMLTLLECHGPGCRGAVITKLASGMRGEYADERGFYRRNLAFLLRRIPRTGQERIEEELDLLTEMISPEEPMMSAKEAVGALGELRHPRAESALADRLRRLEADMIASGGDAERFELADRLCASLARHGSPQAIRAVAAHAYNRAPALGDALSRFETLSRLDLSVDPEQLAELTKAMRTLTPSKVLGMVAKRGQHELSCLMQAVSGTPTIEVRAALETIAERLNGQPLGDQAQRIHAKLEPAAKKSLDALAGDLELFGLPNLLQSLTGAESTGELVLFDANQARLGSIAIARGKITRCEAARLIGEEAVYLFMEKPVPGTFTFRGTPDDGGASAVPHLDPMSLILEGARRHDEYQAAKALAPDGVRFEPTGDPAVRPAEENDAEFALEVWNRAAAGAPANDCELEVKTDPFRVRRLYACWVESRALRPIA